jgi:hypothetical protein
MAAEVERAPVRLWGSDACVLMDVNGGMVRVQVAGQQWESGLSFTVPLSRLRLAVDALEACSRRCGAGDSRGHPGAAVE